MSTPAKLLTPPEAAKALRVSPRRIRAEIEAKRLRAINLGTGIRPSYRIDPDDLRAFLSKLATAPQRVSNPTPELRRPRPKKWDL